MMPRAKVTTLYTLPRDSHGSWFDSTGRYRVYDDACEIVADWAGVSPDRVTFDDDDFLCVDGEPVAFLEVAYVPVPVVSAPVLLQAAE